MARGRTAKKAETETLTRTSSRSSSRAQASPAEIISIGDSKKISGINHYLVKWSKSSKKDTWEPASDVKKVAKSLVEEFENANEDKEFEVEQLTDRKRQGGKVLYYVKWKGYSSSSNTWEEMSSLPDNMIKGYDKRYGPLQSPTKRSKDDKDDTEEKTPKKKAKKSISITPKSTDISIVHSRKIVNNVLHYEVKFVGSGATKTVPIFEIKDIDAIKTWEEENEDASKGIESSEDIEMEYTVEKILKRRGEGKARQYRVKWLGFPNSENTWEKIKNLDGSKHLIAAFDKKQDEIDLKNSEKDYVVERIVQEKFHRKELWYLIKWQGYKYNKNTWEPAEQIKENCADKIQKWEDVKVKRAARREESAKKSEERKEKRKAEREEKAKAKAAEKAKAKAAENSDTKDDKQPEEPEAEAPAEESKPDEAGDKTDEKAEETTPAET